MSEKKQFSKQKVINLYKSHSKLECSKILKTTPITLTRWMVHNGIVIDHHRKRCNPQLIISKKEEEIINGCLLGDGHITREKGKSCQFTYCSSQYEHVYYVYSQLKRMMVKECEKGPKKYKSLDKRTNKTHIGYRIRSQNNITFYNLRQKWYPKGIKIVPSDVKLTPITLMFWYIGDGGLITGERSQYIKLSTHAFNDVDLNNILLPGLKKFSPRLYGNTQKVIYLPHHKIKYFLDTIGPCPVECYNHKWKYKGYKYVRYFRRQNEEKL